jgi:hypothetical protein
VHVVQLIEAGLIDFASLSRLNWTVGADCQRRNRWADADTVKTRGVRSSPSSFSTSELPPLDIHPNTTIYDIPAANRLSSCVEMNEERKSLISDHHVSKLT